MIAAILLAAALLAVPGVARTRIGAGRGTRHTAPARPATPRSDPLAVAATLDVLAACLAAGMTVAAAAAACAPAAPAALATVLRRAAGLLALGADARTAWSPAALPAGVADPHVEALLRWARRSAASGSALADGVGELATRCRQDAANAAAAAAERAGVLIAGPLGLCFLPAFVCLGIVPLVIGLAGDVLSSGLL